MSDEKPKHLPETLYLQMPEGDVHTRQSESDEHADALKKGGWSAKKPEDKAPKKAQKA